MTHPARHRNRGAARPGVFHDVGERLAGDEVGGRFHGGSDRVAGAVTRTGSGRLSATSSSAAARPDLRQHGRVDSVCQVPQLRQYLPEPVPYLGRGSRTPPRRPSASSPPSARQPGPAGAAARRHAGRVRYAVVRRPASTMRARDARTCSSFSRAACAWIWAFFSASPLVWTAASNRPRYLAKAGSAMTTAIGEPSSVRMNSTRRSVWLLVQQGHGVVGVDTADPRHLAVRACRDRLGSGQVEDFQSRVVKGALQRVADRADVGPAGDLSGQRGDVPEQEGALHGRDRKASGIVRSTRFRQYRRR